MVPNGWVEKSLKDICDKTISYGIVQTGENIENGVPCVRVVDLSKNTLNPIEMIKTSEEIHRSYKKTILCEGELMMALRGEIGLVKKVTPELIGANITRGIARLSPIKSVDSDYLLWMLRSNKIKNELTRKSGGSALQEIALGSLRKVALPIPPLPEQRKIAKILSTWDKAISTTEALIETSKQQKKALMQQLLTGKNRLVNPETGEKFEGEWEEVKLSQLVKVTGGNAFKSEQFATQGIPLIKISNIKADYSVNVDSSGFIEEESKYEKFKVKAGDVLIAMSGATTGKVGCYRFDDFSYLNQRVGRFDPKKNKVTKPYLFQLLKLPKVQHDILIDAVGGAQPNISNKDIERLKVKVPVIGEQQKIASVLTTADKEIELLVAKLAHFKQEKKALMQQLLTGKRRVAEE